MPAASLLALLDDIATLLDDVAVLTKTAASKTAGVLGDDLALNAQQVTGLRAERELPVIWGVAKGSLVNKAILVPSALFLSSVLPAAVTPLMMIGGTYLCFEGMEKIAHTVLPHHEEEAAEKKEPEPVVDLATLEREKIKGAVRTDFVLSAEVVVLSLGVVAGASFVSRLLSLVAVGLVMTVGVYGLVAMIVKLDDLGLYLDARGGALAPLGRAIVRVAPLSMKFLSVAGTIAMFVVGGEILAHGVPPVHHALEPLGGFLQAIAGALFGALAGAIVLGIVTLGRRVLVSLRARP